MSNEHYSLQINGQEHQVQAELLMQQQQHLLLQPELQQAPLLIH
jgi:hypothetical protein